MVRGIDSFREWFRGYEENYVVIGGTACDLLLGAVGDTFRATRDIDMVIITEALGAEFGSRIWEYIKTAGYRRHIKSTGMPRCYRFANPRTSVYPAMIEIFTRRIEGFSLTSDATLTPVPFNDYISSLSAILLQDCYYEFLLTGITSIDGIPVLDAAHLIPFKAKAWIDMTAQKEKGGQVDSRSIRKHENPFCQMEQLQCFSTLFLL